jgi:hypothetical protein
VENLDASQGGYAFLWDLHIIYSSKIPICSYMFLMFEVAFSETYSNLTMCAYKIPWLYSTPNFKKGSLGPLGPLGPLAIRFVCWDPCMGPWDPWPLNSWDLVLPDLARLPGLLCQGGLIGLVRTASSIAEYLCPCTPVRCPQHLVGPPL